VGAIYSGVSAVVNILFIVRYNMKLDYFIRQEHFEALAKLMLLFSFAWVYFFFTDFIVEWYGGDSIGHQIISIQVSGNMAPFWFTMLFFNVLIPWLTLWNKRIRSSPLALFMIALGINVGMYLERFIIVTGFLRRNRAPFNWGDYAPSPIEIAIAIGSVSTFLLLYALISRLIPMIPVWEVREGQMAHGTRRIGKAQVTTVAELE
jgi:molybdopterin-containing oxidoreductase family membrane subunit